jgi:ferredoxin
MSRGGLAVLEGSEFGRLFQALRARGYEVVGPRVRDGAIVYDTLASVDDLPTGVGDEQAGGRYRLTARNDGAYFGYAAGPHSWRRFLQPPLARLWSARRTEAGMEITDASEPAPRYALVGVRPCELHAIAVQDRVLLGGPYEDSTYRARRGDAFLVAVNCGSPARTCFCDSLGTGPAAPPGFDLLLTELLETDHRFLVESGSERGAEIAAAIEARAATPADRTAAEAVVSRSRARMGRRLDTDGLKELLYRQYESAHWDRVAERCLACGNCTQVCPTCFCTSIEDATDLSGRQAERRRRWDSCFSLDFSYIHGGSVRTSSGARYRQWMTHKLATWHDQFGSVGCVGCGRCIAWCPAGIDLTEEVAALRREDAGRR